MRKKIALYGAGNIGSTIAQLLAPKDIADVVLFDIDATIAEGKALDIQQAASVSGFNSKITGSNDASIIKDADIVVISAGIPRRKDPETGQFPNRSELTQINQSVIETAANHIKTFAPNSIIIMITNPIDAMCHVVKEVTGFSRERIVGQAGALDTARYKTLIAQELNVSVHDVNGIVLGGHGDSMVPLTGHTTVGSVPILELMSQETLNAIIKRTISGGGEIVKLMGYSSFYTPAASTVMMIESILFDQKKIIPCSVFTEGEYGFNQLFLGLPAVLGANGVESIIDISLNESEKIRLQQSAKTVEEEIAMLA